MKRPLLSSVLVLALLATLAPGAVPPAEAGSWYVGAGFKVGGVHFSLAYDRSHRHYRSHHYYRTKHDLRYRGYGCGSYCFKRSGYRYHHQSCPLLLHHFRRHDYYPGRAGYGTPGYPSYYGYRGHSARPDYYRDYHRHHDPRYCPYR